MKKYPKIFLIALTASFLFACEHEDSPTTTCDVKNPVEDLPWLETKIESLEKYSPFYTYTYIKQGTYLNQTVFVVGNCCPVCNSYFPVYNCAGEEITSSSMQDIANLKIIWKPVGFQCTL